MLQNPSEEQLFRIYNAIWQNLAREDSNVSARIGWAIGLTSGQFTAISFMVSSISRGTDGDIWPIVVGIAVIGISSLGVYFCFRTKLGVEAAHDQAAFLRQQFALYAREFEKAGLPRPFGENKTNQPGRKNSHVFPIALLCFWTLIMIAAIGGTIWGVSQAAVRQGTAPGSYRSTTSLYSNSTGSAPPSAEQPLPKTALVANVQEAPNDLPRR